MTLTLTLPPDAWIMIAGPYSSGAADEEQRQRNLDMLNRAALAVFNRGYIPVIGVNCALPVICASNDGDAFERIMMPLSLAMSERCDACLRVGGASRGADQEVERFRAAGKPVFHSLEEIPEQENGITPTRSASVEGRYPPDPSPRS